MPNDDPADDVTGDPTDEPGREPDAEPDGERPEPGVSRRFPRGAVIVLVAAAALVVAGAVAGVEAMPASIEVLTVDDVDPAVLADDLPEEVLGEVWPESCLLPGKPGIGG